ncbi:unnamed protein product [Allacma fusca]|uniref:Uncharacterized protein n=1 Tax=Allacma fusca TaxID=39272 RepID=A0A8J2NVK0_9HEXA|nr:unnamed protein product [Allacma fusca]
MSGNVNRKCVSGLWLGRSPKCVGNSQQNDYALDKPPTILFRYVNGSMIQSNDGKLVIYTGTTLHMECLWIRKYGTPKWEISNPHKEREGKIEEANKDKEAGSVPDYLRRNYKEGWAPAEEGRDNSLEFRLTIDNAQDEDSGSYTCVTPSRHRHRVQILVKTVDCRPLPEHPDLNYSTTNTQLGTKVTFQCRSGNALVGAQEIVCLASGNWSALLPKCENVECADISLLPAMAPLQFTSVSKNGTVKKNETAPPKITVINRDVGGKAIFTCAPGYILQGSNEAICQSNGEWSSAIPLCREVECPEPASPENGFVSGNPPYKAGDLAQFDCHQGYMMEGQPIVACQDNGKWSRASTVKCVQACTYPGTTIGGTISQVKFYYGILETVTFDCTEGYELQGARMLHCLKNGKWSNSIPVCKALGDKSQAQNDGSESNQKSGKKSDNKSKYSAVN